MMQQYEDAKAACGDALLFFRMGDFYELFHEDAKTASSLLGLTLTSRDKSANPIPMAGFPHHQLESYLGKVIQCGFRAAVCEQVEDPKEAQGLVKREIVRVVSPGTITDDGLLDPRESNFLSAICWPPARGRESERDQGYVGLAWCDLSTGRFQTGVFRAGELSDQLARLAPSEALISDDAEPDSSSWEHSVAQMMRTVRPAWSFSLEGAQTGLAKHFGTKGLDGFGFEENDRLAIRAAGAILDYLQESQRASLDHIDRLIPHRSGESMEIDVATRRSLELTRAMRDGSREGSVLSVIDRTVTPMGSRLLCDWLANPLTNESAINRRLDAVGEFVQAEAEREQVQGVLKGIYDLERLVARVTTGRASPRDLRCVATTLQCLPGTKVLLQARQSELLRELHDRLDLCPELCERLDNALVRDCPLQAREGGFICTGYHAELDRLKELAAGGKQWIAQYQAGESERTGINLKVGFNKVFGYYLEVTNSHKDKVPDEYIRKQTLKNAERYITPELKEYEEKVLSADDRAKELEYEIFVELRDLVMQASRRLQVTADSLARLDVVTSLATLARQRAYCRPTFEEHACLHIVDGRHPVLDQTEPEGTFVPNDTVMEREGEVQLITGPNMAGKSTYIRQVALLTIMAQMGCFVPAKEMRLGIVDRVFARVGASDELSRGQSTFMVEMTETARILNTATAQSLVILDEIGRGTSTYDGLSLAWAIVEYLHEQIACRTFFATHYHELTDLEKSLDRVSNLNVAVKEWDDNVVFLHKIVSGAADKSYGIHVARLAGVPSDVNERAKQVLAQLESEHLDDSGNSRISRKRHDRRGDLQLSLFATVEHPVVTRLRELDVNAITPIQALVELERLRNEALADAK
jgi:DNA mismatch repair protein MutS